MVFASSFYILTNDLPLHPVFVALAERIVRHLSGNDARSGPHQVDDVIALRTAKEQAVSVEVVEPSGRRPLSLQQAVSLQSYQLSQAGVYYVQLANGRHDLIGVNADRRESDLTPMPEDVLALWRGSDTEAGGSAVPNVTPAPATPVSRVTAPGRRRSYCCRARHDRHSDLHHQPLCLHSSQYLEYTRRGVARTRVGGPVRSRHTAMARARVDST